MEQYPSNTLKERNKQAQKKEKKRQLSWTQHLQKCKRWAMATFSRF